MFFGKMGKDKGFDNLGYIEDQRNERTNNADSTGVDEKQADKGACLKYSLLFLILVVLALVIAVVVVSINANSQEMRDYMYNNGKTTPAADIIQQQEVCNTKDCALAAARIIDSLDTSVKPCDDFYTFACGGWKWKNVIPDDQSRQTQFHLVDNEVDVILKYLLEDRRSYTDIEAIKKSRDLYDSCMNTDLIEQLGESVAYDLLSELGGWPVLGSSPGGNWNEGDFNLVRLYATIEQYYNSPMIGISIMEDMMNSDKQIIYIDQPPFGMPSRLYYLDPELEEAREAYVNLATRVAILLGADATTAELDMADMMRLETDLANISTSMEERRDPFSQYNKMTIADLNANFTDPTGGIQFDWLDFFTSIAEINGVNISINESEPIIVTDVAYFSKLFTVLQKYDKRVITNYLVWTFIRFRAFNLDSRFREAIKNYERVVSGAEASPPRWVTCAKYASNVMKQPIGHMFVKETFDSSAKAATGDMIDKLRESFRELLSELEWMDEETKEAAREKMEAMREYIGYPDEIMDTDKINENLETLIIDENDYFGNVLRALNYLNKKHLKKLRSNEDKYKWDGEPYMVNAYYHPLMNGIYFPAGILLPPFYSKDQPEALNYGAIGMVIGHEITHGFDDQGGQYDKNGNLNHWWKPEVMERFKNESQCMVDKYGEFVVPEVNLTLNGINTQGENVADLGGLRMAYRAYRNFVRSRQSEEPKLPGLDFNGNQLFFVGFAQMWCENYKKAEMVQKVKTGVHSPGQFRTIGTLQNSREFSSAFGCKSTQYMNPTKKCEVW